MVSSSTVINAAAICGICVSGYALYVESRLGEKGYEAMCDFSESASCSAVLGSEYSHILSYSGLIPSGSALDVPNAALGLLFYVLSLAHGLFPTGLVLAAATGALAFSAYLAYVLAYVLKDFCLVCVASYVLNVVIFAGASRRALGVKPAAAKKAKKN
jgi:vitamin-K-epoxide reductase (warfarin-sensitive)